MDNTDSEQKFADMAQKYDNHIQTTIPCYNEFFNHTISLIQAINNSPRTWLDTGCGTGAMVEKAMTAFPKTEFFLCDPSPHMLQQAKNKPSLNSQTRIHISDQPLNTKELSFPDESFDVITAIQCHHYMKRDDRQAALNNCRRLLKAGGILVVFENVRPNTQLGIATGLYRWKRFQLMAGKTEEEASVHNQRFDTEYFPITIEQHLHLLRDVGLTSVEMLWSSYMQAGFYAVK